MDGLEEDLGVVRVGVGAAEAVGDFFGEKEVHVVGAAQEEDGEAGFQGFVDQGSSGECGAGSIGLLVRGHGLVEAWKKAGWSGGDPGPVRPRSRKSRKSSVAEDVCGEGWVRFSEAQSSMTGSQLRDMSEWMEAVLRVTQAWAEGWPGMWGARSREGWRMSFFRCRSRMEGALPWEGVRVWMISVMDGPSGVAGWISRS